MTFLEEMEKKLTELDDLRKETDDLRAELDARIAELKKLEEEKPKPPHPRWKPEETENYYVVMSDGTSDMRISHACIDGGMLIRRYSIGNVFKTKEDAEFAIERLKVLAEMREWAGTNKDGAFIYYDYNSDDIMIDWDGGGCYHGDIRFHSIDDAENCVKAVGADRIKRYYFMAPEKEQSDDSAGI